MVLPKMFPASTLIAQGLSPCSLTTYTTEACNLASLRYPIVVLRFSRISCTPFTSSFILVFYPFCSYFAFLFPCISPEGFFSFLLKLYPVLWLRCLVLFTFTNTSPCLVAPPPINVTVLAPPTWLLWMILAGEASSLNLYLGLPLFMAMTASTHLFSGSALSYTRILLATPEGGVLCV